MKKTKIITVTIAVLALMVLAGEVIGQPGGRGRSGQGGGGGPEWGQRMAGRPQMNADLDSAQPDNSWVPGPYCPWAQGPNQNIQPQQGRGRGGFDQYFQRPRGPYCPYCQRPIQNVRSRQGKGPRGFGQGLQGRGIGPAGRGFRRQDTITQRGPMADKGGRGPAILGRGGRGFQRRNIAPQGRRMNGRQGQFRPEGIGRPGSGTQPRQFAPEDQGQPMPPRARGWAPGTGQGRGWRQGMGPGWRQNPQLETAPDVNAPKPPIVEDQTETPQVE